MFSDQILAWGKTRNCMRELSEYGARRKEEIGADKVYDFSLGNPSVAPPPEVDQAIIDILNDPSETAVHAYTTAAGLLSLRKRIAEDLNQRFGCHINENLIYVSHGAASALSLALRAILLPGDEVIVLAPFFTEFRLYTEANGGKLIVVPPAPNFRVDPKSLKEAFTDHTKALIINSPNNPSGAVLTAGDIRSIADILHSEEERRGETIYLITDEAYRDIVYDGIELPAVFSYYDDTMMCYAFSKSLSVPGERIGYLAISDRMKDAEELYFAVLGAGRALGYINPPALFQRVAERCIGITSDMSEYEKNRKDLSEGLREIGYEFVDPDGAFYLFVKALEPDSRAFSERAKAYELLIPPSDDFGCTGYVRVAYCVPNHVIHDAMPAFRALYESYQ